MILKKIIILALSISFFGIFGYFYNKNIPDNWHNRYGLTYNHTAIIYLRSLDENVRILKVRNSSHLNFYDFVGATILNQELLLDNKYSEIRELKIANNQMSFKIDSLENIEEKVDMLMKDINKIISNEIDKRLKTFTDTAKIILETERKFEIQELKDAIAFYKEKNVSPQSIPIKAIDTIDQYLFSETSRDDTVLLESLRKELLVYEKYSSFNKLEFILEEKRRETLSNNINLIKINLLENNLRKHDVLLLAGLKQRYNTRPTLRYSIISFATIGFFLGIIIIFLIVNLKTLKRLVLEKLMISPNQE
jgi:hypothetical protein